MLSEFLFDTPWWVLLLLAIAGIVVFVSGNRRQKKPIERAGLVVLGLALLLFGMSWLVETGREFCVRRTRELVKATDQKDWPTFQARLDPQTSVLMFKGPDVISNSARLAAERVQLGRVFITGLDVSQQPSQIDVNIKVFSEQLGTPGTSDWRLQFLKDSNKWVLYRVEPLPGGMFDPERVARELQRGQ